MTTLEYLSHQLEKTEVEYAEAKPDDQRKMQNRQNIQNPDRRRASARVARMGRGRSHLFAGFGNF